MKAALVIALVAAAGCKTVAKGELYEAALAKELERKGATTSVDCPDAIALGHISTNVFQCRVVATDGSTATFELKLHEEDPSAFEYKVVAGTATPPTRTPDFVAPPPDNDNDPWN